MSEEMTKALEWYQAMTVKERYELADRHRHNFTMPFSNKAILIMFRYEKNEQR